MEDRKKFEKMITNWDNLVNEFQDNVNTDYFEILQEENIEDKRAEGCSAGA